MKDKVPNINRTSNNFVLLQPTKCVLSIICGLSVVDSLFRWYGEESRNIHATS